MRIFALMKTSQPTEILKKYWGFETFRPLQEDIIRSVLEQRDTLALLPTGGGKSICYQVPALCREGLCIVISPLIALMKDQVDHLVRRGVPAAAVYSGMNRRAIDIVLENACNGAYKLLYVSPERLFTDILRERLSRMNINLIAVDEAHCISQWGYDFRPPYLQIAALRPFFGKAPILALTATATPAVVQDIQEKLEFKERNVFQQSFARSNLSYSVLYETKKREKLASMLRSVPGSAIVYLRSRGETKDIANWLLKHHISADFYHAGLPMEERNAKQQSWMDGKTRVMVCTNAFGMGIDKPDVRLVVHLALPDSLEAYFQEAGRAGRDGRKSYAALLYANTDADNLRRQLETAFPPVDLIRRIYQALGSYTQIAIGAGAGESFDFDLIHFCLAYKFEQPTAHAALRILEQDGWITLSESAAAPAKVQITANRETLYDYQLRHKNADLLTKAMLRAYPGVQNDLTAISEQTLAGHCKSTPESVKKILETAQKEGILEYAPANDKPQVTFIRERVAAENLQINLERYHFRKERAINNVEAAIRYAETLQCRSRQLVAYFGEKESANCGICDVCTGRNKPEFSEEAYTALSDKIRSVLKDGPLGVHEIMEAFAPKRHDAVTKTLQYMLEEGILHEREDGGIAVRS
jgi:ATP-dependent DNA helicase RecQ